MFLLHGSLGRLDAEIAENGKVLTLEVDTRYLKVNIIYLLN